jgi:hypothetical protein
MESWGRGVCVHTGPLRFHVRRGPNSQGEGLTPCLTQEYDYSCCSAVHVCAAGEGRSSYHISDNMKAVIMRMSLPWPTPSQVRWCALQQGQRGRPGPGLQGGAAHPQEVFCLQDIQGCALIL